MNAKPKTVTKDAKKKKNQSKPWEPEPGLVGWLVVWWTYIAVAVPQDFVQDVAELPAEDGVAVQREAQRVGPEGVGALLPVSPQNDPCGRDVKDELAPHCFTPFPPRTAPLLGTFFF